MSRVLFFPEPPLEAKLKLEAARQGVSVSILVRSVLNRYYGLVAPNTQTEAELQNEVFDEIEAYIEDPANAKTEFDLNTASPTYSQIDMTYAGRPKVVKARIGRAFAKRTGRGERFEKVEQVLLKNGNPKRTVGNRAAIYRIIPSTR